MTGSSPLEILRALKTKKRYIMDVRKRIYQQYAFIIMKKPTKRKKRIDIYLQMISK